jgi:hypothetical protein
LEVEGDKQPQEGEVLVFTVAGAFCVKGSTHEVAQKLSGEEWPHFELTESSDTVILRSAHVIGIRGGTKSRKGPVGFVHTD